MNDEQRFALHFGPYQTPQFNYGDVVMDEMRGEVTIYKLSTGLIPWPIGKRGAALSPVLYAGLADAIRRESNQAVGYWWGATPATVSRWRKALDVERTTEGSRSLWKQNGQNERSLIGLQKSRANPERAKKSGASRRGKPRPRHVRAALLKASIGRKRSQQSRERQSQTNKLKGIHPPLLGRLWTEAEDELVRTLPAREAAEMTGRKLQAVYDRRHTLGVPDGRRRGSDCGP